MNELTAALKEELNVDTAFTLPIFGGIDIPESIAVSWGIMAFLVIVSILLTRNLKVNHISKRQAILETAVVTMDNFFKDLLGEAGKQYVPYLITVALYIACSNLIGIIGLKPPTKDLNVTAALAIMSIVLIEYSGIHAKGGKRFVHSLAEPIALNDPHEHSGNRHPAHQPVHAFVRQRSGRICHHGTHQTGGSGFCPRNFQPVF